MKWTPPDVVAMMLVIIILIFVLGSFVIHIIGDKANDNDTAVLAWADLMKVIVGGLIGFIGGAKYSKDDDFQN